TVGAGAHKHIKAMPQYDRVAGDSPRAMPVLLFRAWEAELERGEQLLLPHGPHARGVADEFLIFAVHTQTGSRLTCRKTATGEEIWTTWLQFMPSWTGCHADTILLAGAGDLVSLRIADGGWLWAYPSSVPLRAFQLPGPQLLLLEAGRRLIALDAETGEVHWSRWAPAARLGLPEPSGKFNQHYFAGHDRVLIQTSGG